MGAAARTVPPALVEQLASPGRMIIPVGTYSQRLMQVDKDATGEITQKDLFGVVVRCAHTCLSFRLTPFSTYHLQTGQKVICDVEMKEGNVQYLRLKNDQMLFSTRFPVIEKKASIHENS